MLTESKMDYLKHFNVLHSSPTSVQYGLFLNHPFFDPYDGLQVKYEMIRYVYLEKNSITDATSIFGFSRVTFYQLEKRFNQFGLAGLLPKKVGPKKSYKLTPNIISFIEQSRTEEKQHWGKSVMAIKDRFGKTFHVRTLQKALQIREKKP